MLWESGHDCAVRGYLDNAAVPDRHPDIAVGVDAKAISILPNTGSCSGDRVVTQKRTADRPQDAVPVDESAIATTTYVPRVERVENGAGGAVKLVEHAETKRETDHTLLSASTETWRACSASYKR